MSGAGLLSLGMWMFLLIFIFRLGFVRQLFFSGCIFASGCRSVQNGMTWLIIVWNQTFHIEVWMVHDDDDGTS